VTEKTKEIRKQIREASELHGHLGAFLIIGVRIGETAKQILKVKNQRSRELHVSVKVPLQTPFSCILDGIQSTTHCTIGNQRLNVKPSRQTITAQFETTDSDETLTITVNPKIVKGLTDKISKGTSSEVLAETIASTPRNHLLKLDVQRKNR
jgi:formylmethanofuran dehydrogenase subunit E